MNAIGNRLRNLREGIGLPQTKLAALAGVGQTTIHRYESGNAPPSLDILIWYADYFDISVDYLLCRTDKPEGRLYEFKPKYLAENTELRQFIEMCFDPKSSMHDKLKETLVRMLEEAVE